VYKGQKFSRRPVSHVLRDIDLVHDAVEAAIGRVAAATQDPAGPLHREYARRIAHHWIGGGASTVFLQDANALVAPHEDVLRILQHIRLRLPWVERVTSYARSTTIVKMGEARLRELRSAGLDRIHVGYESGSDLVLSFMEKGATKAIHSEAGLMVKEAGIELSAYYMPGLGGQDLLSENALETADLIRTVVPDYVRLRTLAIPDRCPLADDVQAGRFAQATDIEIAQEIALFLEHVGDIPSVLRSDHLLNLLQTLEGSLATDRPAMLAKVRDFLKLEPDEQRLYVIGRRCGIFSGMEDLAVPHRRAHAEQEYHRLGVTEANVDLLAQHLIKRFI